MAINLVQLQDCHNIVKTFEKGCHSSTTEASVFAPLTADLGVMRSMSQTISKQMAAHNDTSLEENLSDKIASTLPEGLQVSPISLGGIELDKGELYAKIKDRPGQAWVFGGGNTFAEFLADCIPCAFRINLKEELEFKLGIEPIGDYIQEILEAFLRRAISQILNIINMFKNLDQYVDLCQFKKFLFDFMCVPDLAKILAVLMALLLDLAFELSGVIDLVISLIMPIFMPFLTNLLDLLQKYLLLVIKPIECIIDSIQNILSKLDYNVLFQNLDSLKGTVINQKGTRAIADLKIPFLSSLMPERGGIEFDLAPAQRQHRNEEQKRIDKVAKELERLRKASGNVDASDPKAVEKHKKAEQTARKEHSDAIRERDLSEIGETSLKLEEFQQGMRGAFLSLISLLREAVLKFDNWIHGLLDEFKKMLGQYAGSSGLYIDFSLKKLIIVQMIAFITAIINAVSNGLDCDDDVEIQAFLNSLPTDRNFKIWTDDQGNVNIEEDVSDIDEGLDALAAATSGKNTGTFGGVGKDNSSMQKLSSLIEYTGDSMLDTEISKVIEALTVPNSIKFNCQLQTSVTNAEQVNQWMQELANE